VEVESSLGGGGGGSWGGGPSKNLCDPNPSSGKTSMRERPRPGGDNKGSGRLKEGRGKIKPESLTKSRTNAPGGVIKRGVVWGKNLKKRKVKKDGSRSLTKGGTNGG